MNNQSQKLRKKAATQQLAQIVPNKSGYFGPYGGRFAPETLMPAITELEAAYEKAIDKSLFV